MVKSKLTVFFTDFIKGSGGRNILLFFSILGSYMHKVTKFFVFKQSNKTSLFLIPTKPNRNHIVI